MKDVVKLSQSSENLVSNLFNLCIMINFATNVTMSKLFLDCDSGLLDRDRRLWAAVHLPAQFDPDNTTILEYIEKALIRALASAKHESLGLAVARDMTFEWTNTSTISPSRTSGKLNDFKNEQEWTVNGRKGGCEEDYYSNICHEERRKRMPCILFNLLARKQIVKNLPHDIFPKGFILTMLVNSPTFGKHKCDFLKVERWDRKRMKFFDGFHGKDQRTHSCQG